MALIFLDSFDYYATADILLKWSANSEMSIQTPGRTGAGAMGHANTSGTPFVTKSGLPSHATYIVGVAFQNTNGAISTRTLLALREGSTVHVDVRIDAAGKLTVTRNGTLLGTGTTVVPNSGWQYLELKATCHDTAGVAVLKLNGVVEINLTGQDTRNGGTGVFDGIQLWSKQSFNDQRTWFDDLYICDGSGSAPSNDFLGDCKVECLLPNGDGATSQLVGSDGNSVNNSLLVDETQENGDTDYVESSNVGEKDTYAFGNLATVTGTVYGVQVIPVAKKTDAGTRQIVSVARLSGTEVDSAAKNLTGGYAQLPDIREAKPGGGAWTIADVNGAEFGVKVTA